jgi:hypothetical protein
MARIVMGGGVAAPCPRVHGISVDRAARRATLDGMSRETVNLICGELPGTEKVPGDMGTDVWTAAHEPFARVGEGVEVMEGGVWVPLPVMSDHDLRERIVAAYEALRHSLPGDVQVTLDRTSG